MRRSPEIAGPPQAEGVGRALREARERLGIDLDELASRTRIPARTLRLLEAEAWDLLPAEVFVRGFVRACARELELDPGDTTARLGAGLAERRRRPAPPPVLVGDLAQNPGPRRVRVALLVLVLIVIATITLSLLLGRGHPPGPGVSWRPGSALTST
jgi:cytoskeletal protein RodZ